MNIFYYSIHHILEDDEIRLFQSLGHNIFCFGVNRKDGAVQGFRPSIEFNPTERQMFDAYADAGGTFNVADPEAKVLPLGFEGHFSAFIIMHDIYFIARLWQRLRTKAVIWRTIGQGVDAYEEVVRPLREDGLRIVRYSPVEKLVPTSCGQDAIIRFYKDPNQYTKWTGEKPSVLTFSNSFQQRYPIEAAAYLEIASRLPCALGGGNNDHLTGAFGFIEFEQQLLFYRKYRVYLYISGMDIPYTLNFIEAWMTGTPVVVYAPLERTGEFFEIDKLVTDGVSGFICRNVDSVINICSDLLRDIDLAARIGSAGRLAAIRYFGRAQISGQWQELLSKLEPV